MVLKQGPHPLLELGEKPEQAGPLSVGLKADDEAGPALGHLRLDRVHLGAQEEVGFHPARQGVGLA